MRGQSCDSHGPTISTADETITPRIGAHQGKGETSLNLLSCVTFGRLCNRWRARPSASSSTFLTLVRYHPFPFPARRYSSVSHWTRSLSISTRFACFASTLFLHFRFFYSGLCWFILVYVWRVRVFQFVNIYLWYLMNLSIDLWSILVVTGFCKLCRCFRLSSSFVFLLVSSCATSF